MGYLFICLYYLFTFIFCRRLFTTAHLNNIFLASLSVGLFFVLHTGQVAIKKLTSPENINQVTSILDPVSDK
jgi:hypothetical protein